MLDKTFDPAAIQAAIYDAWEKSGAFASHPDSAKQPYCIMMPPPNVTGSLHMGHALTFTLQDILTRYHRMKGYDALWQPGTDHAGIATQMVVERQLEAEQSDRYKLGRDKFIERVWQWKAESGGTITRQLRSLGASPDWSRERFTMDEGLSAAVRRVFVQLHREGLIYRDKRLVNWDPKLHTAVSDLEVESRETKGSLWYLKYPVEGTDRFIVVATTRPETMLGDTGVAVNPEDERYKELIGKHVLLPLVGRRIPILGDEHADPTAGSGAVKITPAHDFNDFEVGRRHNLPMVNIFDKDAHIISSEFSDFNFDYRAPDEHGLISAEGDGAVGPSTLSQIPEKYRGMDRFAARKQIVADLEALGLVEKIEPHILTVPYGDRSGVVIEPFLTDQWYVKAGELAKAAIAAVRDGDTVFVPKMWENTFFDWMNNIQPWCVSRQIWWGHQIPAWYGPEGEIFVEETEEAAKAAAEAHFKCSVEVINQEEAIGDRFSGNESLAIKKGVKFIQRDPDVLDTWFSSALWPFSTLGWPEETKELKRYYPTDVLVTGFDIIFFWVARMMMMGCKFLGQVPFKTVYIHALVRDERGQKMSKSKGNIIDPLDLIARYGTDALRFTLTALAAQGRDIKLAESRIEGYRNFATKLWNAARYAEMNGCVRVPGFDPASAKLNINRWIATALSDAQVQTEIALSDFRFNDAANQLYQFTWGTFCDWYIEFTKPILTGSDETAKAETRAMTVWVIEQVVHLLHPIMPYITETLWKHIAGEGAGMLIVAKWPDGAFTDGEAFGEMNFVTQFISEIRSVRTEMNVPAASELAAFVNPLPFAMDAINANFEQIKRLARLKTLDFAKTFEGDYAAKNVIQIVAAGAEVWLDVAGAVDLGKERARLAKEAAGITGELDKIAKKLGNEQFIAKAKPEAIEEQRERQAEYLATLAKLNAAIARIGA